MKHYLKNTSDIALHIGSITIEPNERYEFFDERLKITGNLFKSFRNNFDFELIENGTLLYMIDDAILSVHEFEKRWSNLPDISNHSDEQNFKLYYLLNDDKIYEPINPTIVPKSIDYKTDIKRLHQKLTFNKGILVKCEYFANLTTSKNALGMDVYTFSDNIIKVEMEYYVGANAYIDYRIVKRYWARMDGTYSDDYKESIKYYDAIAAREEGITRRNNIINDTIAAVGGLMIMTMPQHITSIISAETHAMNLLDAIDADINKYIKGNIGVLINKVETLDVSTLTGIEMGNWFENPVPDTSVTIRQYLLSKLTDGVLVPNEIIKIT